MNNGKYWRNLLKSSLRYGDVNYYCQGACTPRKFSNRTKDRKTMPRDKLQLQMMQRQREKLMEKSKMYSPSSVTLQVLGSGARGGATSLYVSTDHTKYLFNCGEGTQRLAYEHRHKLSKLEHIFITTPRWKNFGGLPGIALTVQDNGTPKIKIHGPSGTVDIFRAVERFVILRDLKVTQATCREDKPFVDHVMSIRYVHLTKDQSESTSDSDSETDVNFEDIDYYAYEINPNGKRSSSQQNVGRKITKLDDLSTGGRVDGSMAYICKLHDKQGTLQLEKCVDMGVEPGPCLGELKAGKDITLPDGRIVRSADVCSPIQPGPVFIVVECPSEDYLDSLTNSEAFAEYQGSSDDAASCVVHFTPENIIKNSRYRQWMEKFPASTRHMIINEENTCLGSEAIHRLQHQLHLLHPTIFPFLDTEGIAVHEKDTKTFDVVDKIGAKNDNEDSMVNDKAPIEDEFPLIARVKTLDAFHLRPIQSFDKSAEIFLTPHAYIDETFAVDGFLDSLAELQTAINACTRDSVNNDEYPSVLMLGTGSCIPNKTRNTSGIFLRLDEDRSVILDCGEGTAGQLLRFYGRKNFDKILSTIKAIYVSHLHTDHHIGLIGLLNERSRVTKEPVMLMAPDQLSWLLKMYHKRFEPIAKTFRLVSNKHFALSDGKLSVSMKLMMDEVLPGVKINTVRVRHCPHAYGVSLTTEKGCKIVYSGDTMPCESLVDLGTDCDLLIHEATMEDELEDEAKMKFHSTVSQAIGIGEQMGAKFILLTHFSQRYSKILHLPEKEETTTILSRVGIAYDMMHVKLSELNLLPLMYPSLKSMFGEFCLLLEEKSLKRQVRMKLDARWKAGENSQKMSIKGLKS